MGSVPRPKKQSRTEKSIRAGTYRKGYEQAIADVSKNVNSETRKLNAEATTIMMEQCEGERQVGNPRVAFIMATLTEWCGDPATLASYKPHSE